MGSHLRVVGGRDVVGWEVRELGHGGGWVVRWACTHALMGTDVCAGGEHFVVGGWGCACGWALC